MFATAQPDSGMMVYCRITPAAIQPGICAIRVKSRAVSVMPMPSMMTPSPAVIQAPLNQVNTAGCHSASALQAITHSGKAPAKRSDSDVMLLSLSSKKLFAFDFLAVDRRARQVETDQVVAVV